MPTDQESDVPELLRLLAARGETLATAESLTGGRLAALVTSVPGASASFRGGVVAYATEVKQQLLGVPGELLARHGAVSSACARAMAQGVRERTSATWGVSTTGVAGPERQEGHPVGTVFVAVAGPGGATSLALQLEGDRATIQEHTVAGAVTALLGILHREEPGLG